jgi:hypothetical protein
MLCMQQRSDMYKLFCSARQMDESTIVCVWTAFIWLWIGIMARFHIQYIQIIEPSDFMRMYCLTECLSASQDIRF